MRFPVRFLALARAVALGLAFGAAFEWDREGGLGLLAVGAGFRRGFVGGGWLLALGGRAGLGAHERGHVENGHRHVVELFEYLAWGIDGVGCEV